MFESEYNNSATTADTLTSGVPIKGQLANLNDIDAYSLVTTGPGTIDIAFDSPTDTNYMDHFEIILSEETTYGTNKIASQKTGKDTSFTVGVEEAGTYYVFVNSSDSYRYNDEEYSLTATSTAGDTSSFETEDNNYYHQADTLTSGVPIKGQLANLNDIDAYSLVTTGPGTIDIAFDSPTDTNYMDHFEIILSEETTYGTNKIASQKTGKDTSFTVGVEEAGTYYVFINSSSNYSYNDEEYSLTATSTVGDTSNIETEHNNSTTTADTLTSGIPIKGQLSDLHDYDWYSLVTTASGTIDIAFDSPTDIDYMDYFEINLVGDTGVIASQKTGKDTSFTAGVEEAGTYYVLVNSSSNYSYNDEEYSLTATSTAGDTSSIETEDNNLYHQADTLTSGNPIKGQLANLNDIDVYSLVTTGPGTIDIAFDSPTDIDYMDFFEIILSEETTGGTNKIVSQKTGKDTSFTVGVEGAGTYYVFINSSSNYSYNARSIV